MPNLLQGGRGRPLHPMLVHFPIALYPTSLVFDALSHVSEDGNPFVVGAFSLIVIALVVSLGQWLSMRAAGHVDMHLLPEHSRRHVRWMTVNSGHIQLTCAGLAAVAVCLQMALALS